MDKELIQNLMEKATESMRRDINHIFTSVSRTKLDASSARDLVAYIKVLKELETIPDAEMERLKKMNEAELKAEATKLIEENGKKK